MAYPAESSWALEEFGDAVLGNKRRTDRLVQMAAKVAAAPAGRITSVFLESAAREGAFRFVENSAIKPDAVAAASHRACARRARDHSFVYVPVDGTSLNISDWQRSKGLGIVGARYVGATGLQVMTAIGVAPDGTALGLCGQEFWARRGRSRRTGPKDKRRVESRETNYWLQVIEGVARVFNAQAPGTVPWFQLDRGGDAWPVLMLAHERSLCVTVRSGRNRRLWGTTKTGRRKYLWNELSRKPIRGWQHLDVPAAPNREARVAKMAIRFAEVTLDLHNSRMKRSRPARFWAVLTREVGTTPQGEPPLEWLLLTTRPVADISDAQAVIDGYGQRWSVEEFHRTWKSGVCDVEGTQLRACDHIERWATILAAVAVRVQRLTKLARSEPNLPATAELSQAEIDALISTRKKTTYRQGDVPTIAEAVTWLAEVGGYTGKSSGGPPGATVLSRGLNKIQLLAEYFQRRQDEGT